MTKLAENCEDVRKELSELHRDTWGYGYHLNIGLYRLSIFTFRTRGDKPPIIDSIINHDLLYILLRYEDQGFPLDYKTDPLFECIRDLPYDYFDGTSISLDRLCQLVIYLKRLSKLTAFS